MLLHIVNDADAMMRRTYKAGGKQHALFGSKVAEKLCIGGACYLLFPNEDPNNLNGGVVVLDETIGNYIEMMKTFVLTKVVPTICKRLPESCALVLGKALLWFIYSNDAISNNFLPEEFKNRIKNSNNNLSEILTASSSPLVVIKGAFLLIQLMALSMLVILQLLVWEEVGDRHLEFMHN